MAASASDPYDIFSPQAQRNAELYALMRQDDPVHRAIHPQTGQAFWFLTRYDDCLAFLKDRRFGKEFRRRWPLHTAVQWIANDTEDIINQHMLNLDDPNHARLRSIVQLMFAPAGINSLRPRFQAIADDLLDSIDRDCVDEEINLTERYISQFPLLAIAELLGIPAEDHADLYRWTQHMLGSDQETVRHAVAEFSSYINEQIDLRRCTSIISDDLLSELIRSEDVGCRLTRQELLAMVFLFITAGYETMVNFISNSIMSLFENQEQLQLLQKHIDTVEVLRIAIEEMLRYNGPSHMTLPSWAYENVTMRNRCIQTGDIVHAVLFAANRDPLVFDHPDRFDILRQPNRHIAFSHGIHHCLGSVLARLEGEIAVGTLLRRVPNL